VVAKRREQLDRFLAGHRRADRHRRLRNVPQPRGIDLEVFALPADEFAAEQFADDFDRLAQHLVTAVDGGPAPAHDVFVEVLPGAQAQREASIGDDLQRRCLLRDDRGVVTHDRAGHVGEQLDTVGCLCDRAEHRPSVGRVSL
jgi:hypothetical protein